MACRWSSRNTQYLATVFGLLDEHSLWQPEIIIIGTLFTIHRSYNKCNNNEKLGDI